jgi:CDP-diglyceride synthetase
VWVGAVVFWAAWVSGPVGATVLFGVVSFLALREFVTLVKTRRGDHRSLLLAFFGVLPLQYVLVANRNFDLFSVFIPVYVFLAIPVVSALAGDPQRFLERNAKIQWGIMVCVYGLGHAPALVLLDFPGHGGRGAFLLFFLVVVTVGAQLAQTAASRRLRRRPVARHIDRSFSLRAWGIGIAAGAALGAGAVLDHAVQAGPGPGHGHHRRGRRHAGRTGDERAQARCRRALLGQHQLGDRRGGPARPGGTAVLCGAGVLPFGALVLPAEAMMRTP